MRAFPENIFMYKHRLDKALLEKRPYSTYNRDIIHATIIVAGGFKHAKKEVNLLSHELDNKIYGLPNVVKLVEDFLSQRDGKLNIITEKKIGSDHPLINLCDKYPNAVVKKIPDEWWQKMYSYNFMTIDDFGYRFEADRAKPSAVASFYEKEEKDTLEGLKDWFFFWSNAIDNNPSVAG